MTLGHLRRFCNPKQLPAPLRSAIEADGNFSATPGKTIFVLIFPCPADVEELKALLAPFTPLNPATPPWSTETPMDTSSVETPSPEVHLLRIKVPIQPPYNYEQADRWTDTLWPVVFNPAAPRATIAPPPQVVYGALATINPRAGYYLALARKVAEESEQSGRGRGVGAVIADPEIERDLEVYACKYWRPAFERWMDAVVAVGGDARYARSEAGFPSQTDLHPGVAPNPASEAYNADLEGGPDLHALMRATELVARRRREDSLHEAETAALTPPSVVASDPQLSMKLSPLEHHFLYGRDTVTPRLPTSTSSPKKRKHEEPNPESRAEPVEPSADPHSQSTQPDTTDAPLPAPPPATTALADHSMPLANTKPNEPASSPSSPPFPAASDTGDEITSKIRTRSQGGYLCTDLDVYLSHEPCLCCSMGILLSRFRAVIFPRSGRMKTGGLASESVISATLASNIYASPEKSTEESADTESSDDRVYYGLHWRKELNWRALGYEFVEEETGNAKTDERESVDFHA